MNNNKNTTPSAEQVRRVSKFLSLVLRHAPEKIGLELDASGWTPVADLLMKATQAAVRIDRTLLQHVVATNDKQRFALSDDGERIRANQGHTVSVDLGLAAAVPPAVLYHGTATRFLDAILDQGLTPQRRHDVHLTESLDTAAAVGRRYGQLAMLRIDAAAMHADGLRFSRSDNGVWLTAAVSPRYLSLVEMPSPR